MSVNDRILKLAAALEWREWLRRTLIWGTHLGLFLVSGVAAFLLRFDFSIPTSESRDLMFGLAVWLISKSAAFRWLELDRGWWRYVSIRDVARLVAANLVASALACLALLWLAPKGFPRSIYVLDFLVCLGMTAGVRMAARLSFEFSRVANPGTKKRILIYGAGDAGVTLLREIRQNPALAYEIAGFIDDDPVKTGRFIDGAKVFGDGAALPSIVASETIETVLIALPSATGAQMTVILSHCHEARVSYKTVPGLAEVIEGNGLATQIRAVAVEDLLGRTPVRLEHNRISAKLTGNTVLVTGAAGSIGSELCRQIARFNPAGIVGFEIAESPLFEIDREMRQSFPKIPFYPEIGSIQNKQRLAEVLEQYRPSILYHAAAYKHVPMMEAHVFEAVENNVFGTWNVALAAARHGVEDFVMISSDKAVRPTNIMGATKRAAELLILELQNGGTKFVSVRFGNVLGSSGSVIPIFKQQIAAGGPVTVTHPEMRRYFMTISEASQLVLQASTMGRGGEIFVLNMGAPVKIVDLARNLILLSGLRPDEDIKIEFTGVRPGEKLYEELNSMEEDTLPTPYEKINIFTGNGLPSAGMEPYLEALRDTCDRRDVFELVLTLKDLIRDYNPSAELLRRTVHVPKTAVSATPRAKAVAAR
jgi:FlaA1/EpsC-like NDP-sugar epimerase